MIEDKEIKYLIFDYGDVLVYPVTGHWFIPPKFYDIINTNKINMIKFNEAIGKVDYLISQTMKNEDEEYKAFCDVYYNILNDLGFNEHAKELAEKIAFDFVYNDEKHSLYSDVKENLERLSKKYKLILLSDNWPCACRLLKYWNIDKLFEKIYISSIYNSQKKNKKFFDYPINDFNIKDGEAIFIDDKIELLDIANEKGLKTILMDRENKVENCQYKIIQSLVEL